MGRQLRAEERETAADPAAPIRRPRQPLLPAAPGVRTHNASTQITQHKSQNTILSHVMAVHAARFYGFDFSDTNLVSNEARFCFKYDILNLAQNRRIMRHEQWGSA